ncbi:hypothetical protein G9464_09920 [Halostella sp. JP-L12]|uniref:hypothetical protein n=1 Tax=Halostella TaxID=1843185 RepID=UPI000EF7EC69|nr:MULTISPECIES: hypothetical protein [Halostella]NHN47913.1 hypothetical protein [Halostella sp. JP-L12]
MCNAFAFDPEVPPYNTAYVVDDRSHLYAAFDLDRDGDDGVVENGERNAPADYGARREAVLSFYGDRCGRCLTELGRTGDAEQSLGFVVSVADGERRWALESLVAVCEACYDLLTGETPAELSQFGTAFESAPQFPQWACDPRVAVERAPLSGREAWRRERLAAAARSPPDCGANAVAAERAWLARETSAARAVALGERHLTRAWRSPPARGLDEEWESLSPARRRQYEERAVDVESVVDADGVDPTEESPSSGR